MDLSTVISGYVMQFVSATPVVIVIATGLTMLLPTKLNTKKDNAGVKLINIALKTLNIVAGNILKNKNADETK